MRIAAFLLAAISLPANAGPPFLTGDPDPADAGHWEISVGLLGERRPDERAYRLPAFEVNYGLGSGLEVSFESAWLRVSGRQSASGIDNSVLGAWRILEEEKHGFRSPSSRVGIPQRAPARKGLVEDERLCHLRIQKGVGPAQLGIAVARIHPAKSPDGWEYGVSVKHETEGGSVRGRLTADRTASARAS